jgi:hypothetical protein
VARRGWKWLRSGQDAPPNDAFTAPEDHEDESWNLEPATAAPVPVAAPELEETFDEIFAEPALGPEPAAPVQLFGAPGLMDEDGFSEQRTYSEKADAERAVLATIERRLADARASFDMLKVDALRGYANDLRDRIARFDALAADAGNRAA